MMRMDTRLRELRLPKLTKFLVWLDARRPVFKALH